MLFWHSQPEHYWPSPAEHYQGPTSSIFRETLPLPFLKQEEQPVSATTELHCPTFQCVLCAATSPAIKLQDETLTYLNQGQSYEIRMLSSWRQGGESSGCRKLLKSMIRVGFHDRRLQYTERQQLEGWRWSRPGDRILDIDIPLSVGVMEPHMHPTLLNTVEFLWDPTRRTSVFVQVHCISTEFTLRKNGGEKGVPFRLQIDTFKADESGAHTEPLYSASCQIKVFKPKGADRKQKTDREKIEKRSLQEREKYQPSYETTVLSGCTPWPDSEVSSSQHSPPSTPGLSSPTPERTCPSPACPSASSPESTAEALSLSATLQDTQQWLIRNRFSSYCRTLGNFTGADLMKLSRSDLIQICGAADGIRLSNMLKARSVRPRLTIYVCTEAEEDSKTSKNAATALYRELHLQELTATELINQLADLISVPASQIQWVSRQGPSGIQILISDVMVRNLPDELSFRATMKKAQNADGYHIVLR
ncbi:transcription factor CP2-like protein 1 isoform X2 [Rhinatrema bivittatum]|uniref:transcription factor CP2-like protein 1 isoform X2 n=1 Tax=Rhinatrema bivittatum TaxID=194408 RepID=UPI001129F412|nr:transcription factor CP2-like protein 1 isoform X2 [Rhinatrema bivittatum]